MRGLDGWYGLNRDRNRGLGVSLAFGRGFLQTALKTFQAGCMPYCPSLNPWRPRRLADGNPRRHGFVNSNPRTADCVCSLSDRMAICGRCCSAQWVNRADGKFFSPTQSCSFESMIFRAPLPFLCAFVQMCHQEPSVVSGIRSVFSPKSQISVPLVTDFR